MIRKSIILISMTIFTLSIGISLFGEVEEEGRAEGLARDKARAEAKLRLEEMGNLTAGEHYQRGREYYGIREFPRALKEFEEALELDPEHRGAAKYLKKVQSKLRKLVRDKEEVKARVKKLKKEDEKEKTKEAQAKEYLMRGTEYYNNGQFKKAKEAWEKILSLTLPSHPYYQRARVLISKVWEIELDKEREEVKKKKELEEKARLLEVEKAWMPSRLDKGKEVDRMEESLETKKLFTEKAGLLVSLDFENTHLREILRYLSEVSGMSIVLDETIFRAGEDRIGPEGISPRVTIQLKDIPLLEALEVILRVKGLKFRLESNAIWVTTLENLEKEEFITRIFQLTSGPGTIEEVLRGSVPWPDGSTINLDRRTGTLIVTNSPANMELIEDIIRSLDITPIQVAIEAKIIEIYADSLKELGIDLGDSAGPSFSLDDWDVKTQSNFEPRSQRWVGSLQDYAGEGLSLSYFRLNSSNQFDVLLKAIEKTGKSNLLSSPTVTVLNNQEAEIRVAKPFNYPKSYTVNKETVEMSVIGGQPVSIRRDNLEGKNFTSRNIGVTLTVTPSVGTKRKVISLRIEPETVELVGWTEFVNVEEVNWYVAQPIFFTRTIRSNMMVGDGETVVLGGLIMEETVKDQTKVPLLGDIPFLGRLFRRDVNTEYKRNLLIFITVRILTPTGEEFKG